MSQSKVKSFPLLTTFSPRRSKSEENYGTSSSEEQSIRKRGKKEKVEKVEEISTPSSQNEIDEIKIVDSQIVNEELLIQENLNESREEKEKEKEKETREDKKEKEKEIDEKEDEDENRRRSSRRSNSQKPSYNMKWKGWDNFQVTQIQRPWAYRDDTFESKFLKKIIEGTKNEEKKDDKIQTNQEEEEEEHESEKAIKDQKKDVLPKQQSKVKVQGKIKGRVKGKGKGRGRSLGRRGWKKAKKEGEEIKNEEEEEEEEQEIQEDEIEEEIKEEGLVEEEEEENFPKSKVNNSITPDFNESKNQNVNISVDEFEFNEISEDEIDQQKRAKNSELIPEKDNGTKVVATGMTINNDGIVHQRNNSSPQAKVKEESISKIGNQENGAEKAQLQLQQNESQIEVHEEIMIDNEMDDDETQIGEDEELQKSDLIESIEEIERETLNQEEKKKEKEKEERERIDYEDLSFSENESQIIIQRNPKRKYLSIESDEETDLSPKRGLISYLEDIFSSNLFSFFFSQ